MRYALRVVAVRIPVTSPEARVVRVCRVGKKVMRKALKVSMYLTVFIFAACAGVMIASNGNVTDSMLRFMAACATCGTATSSLFAALAALRQ